MSSARKPCDEPVSRFRYTVTLRAFSLIRIGASTVAGYLLGCLARCGRLDCWKNFQKSGAAFPYLRGTSARREDKSGGTGGATAIHH